nr:hypothetical protein [uncultured Caldimonas sp.]
MQFDAVRDVLLLLLARAGAAVRSGLVARRGTPGSERLQRRAFAGHADFQDTVPRIHYLPPTRAAARKEPMQVGPA